MTDPCEYCGEEFCHTHCDYCGEAADGRVCASCGRFTCEIEAMEVGDAREARGLPRGPGVASRMDRR